MCEPVGFPQQLLPRFGQEKQLCCCAAANEKTTRELTCCSVLVGTLWDQEIQRLLDRGVGVLGKSACKSSWKGRGHKPVTFVYRKSPL